MAIRKRKTQTGIQSPKFEVGDVIRSESNDNRYVVVGIDRTLCEYAIVNEAHQDNYDWITWDTYADTEHTCALVCRPIKCSNDKKEMEEYLLYRRQLKPMSLEEWRKSK